MADNSFICKICGTRRSRRYCPGVGGDICAVCCGTEREVTVNCPLECPYLREARAREKEPNVDPREFPNQDVRVNEDFLRKNEPLLILLAAAVAKGALETEGAVDGDVKEALDGLVRTYKTLQSGLVYESRPANPLASRVFEEVQARVEDIRRRLAEHSGMQTVRDADVLGILAFLQRLELQHNNGRPKGRAFIDWLRQFFPQESASPLITT
jgi:hypothetical protein